jgi:hypothetical protein
VFWFDDQHGAWSANEQVRQEVRSIQARKDKLSLTISSVGLVLVVVLTIASGDWHMFFAFLILIAGLIMLVGSMLNL